jgi:hypothetical protein
MNNPFQNYIKVNTISSLMPKLNGAEVTILSGLLMKIIRFLRTKFDVDENTFILNLKENNDRNLKSLLFIIIPFIDDANDSYLLKQIEHLRDITTKRKNDVDLYNVTNNNYLISNYQFSRFIPETIDTDTFSALSEKQAVNSVYNNGYYDYHLSVRDIEMATELLMKTINTIGDKLFINWINVVPVLESEFKKSRKYSNSFFFQDGSFQYKIDGVTKPFNFVNYDEPSTQLYSGVTADDVFNTIFNYLFKDIYNSGAKWLLYEKQLTSNARPTMFIETINDIMDIKLFGNDIIFDLLTSKQKTNATTKWNGILKQIISDSDQRYHDFVQVLIFKLDMNFITSEIESEYGYDSHSFYKKLRFSEEDEDNFLDFSKLKKEERGSDNNFYNEYIQKLEEIMEKLPFTVIHQFLKEEIDKFSVTWYGREIIKLDKDNNITLQPELFRSESGSYVTYKNIYNYAKYLSLDFSRKSHIANALSLRKEEQESFITKLNSSEGFNVRRVLRRTYGGISSQGVDALHSEISQYFLTNLKDIVFTNQIRLGLLNEFVLNNDLTDESINTDNLKVVKAKLKKIYKKGSKYLSSYYFLTRRPFSELEIYNEKTKEQIDYFQHLFDTGPAEWYGSFAMSWVSQINFYHHYMNNRVMFVTGATGQGKSVIVPKLILYATYAIDLKGKGKVISTQPTIAPTKKNAVMISTNLGVPIKINGHSTFSPYVMYSTQKDKHKVKSNNMSITEVTDGTLLEQLLGNPLLKLPTRNKKSPFNEYTNDNIYDTVIIDEAHMHTTSIDLILTLMRNTIVANNQIKLVITSATMDDDEYIYRRYYRHVDDNFNFPINPMIVGGSVMDRITVDRRFHISPPGKTTAHVVNDIYLKTPTVSYDESKKACLSILNTVMSKNKSGDILFFTTGTLRANQIVETINKTSPSYVIALPLYAGLRPSKDGDGESINWFEFISNIDSNLHSIPYSKHDILDIILGKKKSGTPIPKNTYTVAVLVATNVVEASVTISTLRTVIDTGYYTSVTYNEDKNAADVAILPIPEASRKQRRGRVGRVASGDVYYGYKEGARAHIKPDYGVETTNITNILFRMMRFNKEGNEELPIFQQQTHPMMYYLLNKDPELTFEQFIEQEPNIETRKMFRKQYNIGPSTTPIVNRDMNFIQYHMNTFPRSGFSNGFDYDTIYDENGSFYLINPHESKLQRNVMTSTLIPDTFEMRKMSKFMQMLKTLKLLKFNKDDNGKISVHKYEYVAIIDEILQQDGEHMQELLEDDKFKIIKTILTAHCYDVVDDVLKILSFAYAFEGYSNLIYKGENMFPSRSVSDSFVRQWTSGSSELVTFLNIMDIFIVFASGTESNENIVTSTSVDNRFKMFMEMKAKSSNKMFIDDKILKANGIVPEELESFVKFANNKTVASDRQIEYNGIAKDEVLMGQNINKYASTLFMEGKPIIKALKTYASLKKLYANQSENMEKFRGMYDVVKTNTSDNITKSFLETYLYNISKPDMNNKIIRTIIPDIDDSVEFPPISLMRIPDTYLFYIRKVMQLRINVPLGLVAIPEQLISDVYDISLIEKLAKN